MHGLETQMDEVARAAGVGVGTLYRHFPTKEALIEALVIERMETVLAELSAAVDGEPTPWDAFARFVRHLAAVKVVDRSLKQAIGGRLPDSEPVRERMIVLQERVCDLVARAQAAGQLRADVAPGDLPLILGELEMLASPRAASAVDRYVAIVLDGLRAQGQAPLPGEPLTLAQVEEILRESGC